jgi:hypothetical protein
MGVVRTSLYMYNQGLEVSTITVLSSKIKFNVNSVPIKNTACQ